MTETPTHKQIKAKIKDLVNGNFSDREHARESLDDIIYDLNKYRAKLPTVEQYAKANLLQELRYNIDMKKLNPAIPYNGGEISIQASEHHYCIPKQDEGPYSAFEIAVFNRKGDRIVEDAFKGHEDGDDAPVYGFVPVTKLIMALKKDGYSDINVAGILERLGN